jgi:hypothetical protein
VKNYLPAELRFSHDYSLWLHDGLAQIVVEGQRRGLFETRVDLVDAVQREKFESAPHVLDWIEGEGRSELMAEVLLKAILPALLSDFCHFIYESLSCSRKGKLGVAYALLRKPLRENLHYLEWIVARPEDFLNTFYGGEPRELSFSHIGDAARVKSVIATAVARCPSSEAFLPDYLFDIRFDKACPYGLELYWNRALHLITTKAPIDTERQNFNFVFSSEDDIAGQWALYYTHVPLLLYYAAELTEVLLAYATNALMPDIAHAVMHRIVGFLYWVRESPAGLGGRAEEEGAGLQALLCPSCAFPIPGDKQTYEKLFYGKRLSCAKCKHRLSVSSLVRAEA